MTVDVGLAEATLAVADLAAPKAQVTAGGTAIEPLLQAGLDETILGGCGSR
jgi:hypothetical protein